MSRIKPTNVDEYIKNAPEQARVMLNEFRALLKSVAPNASEGLNRGKPVLIEKGTPVHFSSL